MLSVQSKEIREVDGARSFSLATYRKDIFSRLPSSLGTPPLKLQPATILKRYIASNSVSLFGDCMRKCRVDNNELGMHRLQRGKLPKVPDRSRQRTTEINVEGKIPAMQMHVL